ncbi:hypothetical protein ICW40_12395 [Actinotalea ferrariae]|uniref:hypothetical protein n=1 Tax=Actinotalea ferrariae TaxID=1386098 RepID=UPI001C8C184D|nr:hypothetical protein [Actinotalea ferrariae]MBX9245601.1 hypothetical protein [Actinotalea ferrariae]
MQEFRGARFEDARIELDEKRFVECHFERCTLVYSGSSQVGIEGCEFADCKWEIDGAAAATMAFMRGIYHGVEDGGGKKLVHDLWRQIERP